MTFPQIREQAIRRYAQRCKENPKIMVEDFDKLWQAQPAFVEFMRSVAVAMEWRAVPPSEIFAIGMEAVTAFLHLLEETRKELQ